MVSSIDRRQFLGGAAAAIATGLSGTLVSCTGGPLRTGRIFAYSNNSARQPAGAADETEARRSAFGDLRSLTSELAPGDTVVFPDDRYPLEGPVHLLDGVRYRAAAGARAPPVLDARGRLDFCLTGTGSRDISIEGLQCVNARKNGIDIAADPLTGRLPGNVLVRGCRCSNNGRDVGERPGRGLRHEEGNGIAIHSGANYRTRLEETTAGIVVEDSEAHDNLHAGILIDLPGVGHRISRCQAGGNGRETGTNAWGILVRPAGGALLKGWQPSGPGVWQVPVARFRNQVPVHIVCTRFRSRAGARWRNTAWDLSRTGGDQRRPGVGEFGVVQAPPRNHPVLFINVGPVQQFRVVICWIGDCREPVIENCMAWGQGGRDGVGIGFDQNTIDGAIRNCSGHGNKVGLSLHINRGGTLTDNVAFGNSEYGCTADRNLGRMKVTGTTAYDNGAADFFFDVFERGKTRLELAGNRAYSRTGYLGSSYKAALSVGDGAETANVYCGDGVATEGLPSLAPVRTPARCRR